MGIIKSKKKTTEKNQNLLCFIRLYILYHDMK